MTPVQATVKLIRVLANLSMEAGIGIVARNSPAFDALVSLLPHVLDVVHLEELVRCWGHSQPALQCESQLLNVVAAVTNLTYYEAEGLDPDNTSTVTLTANLIQCLLHTNDEVVLEGVRALGNLTRHVEVRSPRYTVVYVVR
jgi:hypothetical protein